MIIPLNNDLEGRIRDFFNYWRQRHAFINNLDLSTHNHEANVLLWASLDALSNWWSKGIGKDLCDNQNIKEKEKKLVFDAFLAHYGGALFQIVSLPDVWRRVDEILSTPKKNQNPKLNDETLNFLVNIGDRRIDLPEWDVDNWPIRQPSHDWNLDKVIEFCIVKLHSEAHKKDLNKWLVKSRYGAIAYVEMRCAYIHEGQSGSGTHGFNDNNKSLRQPTYATSIYVTPPAIGFSVGFMLRVLEDCIKAFEDESLTLQRDPVPNSTNNTNF
jgi:hypothetical protein